MGHWSGHGSLALTDRYRGCWVASPYCIAAGVDIVMCASSHLGLQPLATKEEVARAAPLEPEACRKIKK